MDINAKATAAGYDEPHVFSKSYEWRKHALLAEVSGEGAQTGAKAPANNRPLRLRFTWRMVAIAAAVCVALPVAAYAAITHADLFNDLFGIGFRESVPAAQVIQPGVGDKTDVMVTLPAKDYVDVDPKTAEAMLGQYMSAESVTVQSADGHTLTISNAVRSDEALLYRFTLEREGGQTALFYSEHTNRAKGAMASESAQMSWTVAGDEFLYIDLDASTDERVVGYAYSALDGLLAGQELIGVLRDYSGPASNTETLGVAETEFAVPCGATVPSTSFTNIDGGLAMLSPLGLSLDTHVGLFSPFASSGCSMADDPFWVRKIQVNYADGTSYTVLDEDSEIDNTASLCGYNSGLALVFNRLVDPAKVKSIDVIVIDVPSGDPADLRVVDGDWPETYPKKTATYTLTQH